MNRPLGVTLVAIVAWLNGFFQIIGAIFVVIGGLLITPVALIGWLSLAIGIITLVVGVGLWKGNPTARTVAIIVFSITVILGIVSLFSGEGFWSVLAGSFLSIVGLILLSTQNARRYFAR
ncbi:hypothetical protein [Microbacterium aurantiacum]|uniref:hypothetical protein n=1 Tax=Microbacterium aurantiacum TaxID=162393 RepID=UPI00342D2E91